MFSFSTKVRVRYSETDNMGYVYYGNYPQFYEVGRTELMRSLGMSYRKLEKIGILMPVVDLEVKYLRPSFYDDELTIETKIQEMPVSRIYFSYEIFNGKGVLVNRGKTTLAFINASTRRPTRAPEGIIKALQPYFKKTGSGNK